MNTTSNTQSPKRQSKMIASYIDRIPPCNHACPVGQNIQRWMQLVQQQRFRDAWEEITKHNPFPAIHGRVCYHPCESKCNRKRHDSSVRVRCVERFIGDMALAEGWSFTAGPATGKKVLIVGAGAAGLSAAYHMRRYGHEVTIYDVLPRPGGMMLTGIPVYRLPRDILKAETDRIINMGVNVEFNHYVEDVLYERAKGEFDVVFVAVGAHKGKNLFFPMEDPCPVIDAVDYLRGVILDTPPIFGNRLVVYGGGNTAIDVARTARRLGVTDVNLVYHRSRQKMPALAQEIEEALKEGVNFHFLRGIKSLERNNLVLNVNTLDEKGSPRPTGTTEILATDVVVLALSQSADTEFLRKVNGIEFTSNDSVVVEPNFMTSYPGIFAGGDMLPYARSVTTAVGHGKQAARHMDAYLRGTGYITPPRHELAAYEYLHPSPDRLSEISTVEVDVATRLQSFVEVYKGCTQEEATYEASRCFSCGNCYECDGCYGTCPVKAITKLGFEKRYKIDTEKCIGCSKCFKICPCGAIVMTERKV